MLKDPVVYNQYLSALEILDVVHCSVGTKPKSFEKSLMKAASIGSFKGAILSLLLDAYNRMKTDKEAFKGIFYTYAFGSDILNTMQEHFNLGSMDYLLYECENELLLETIIGREQFNLFENRIKRLNLTPINCGETMTEKIMIMDKLNNRLLEVRRKKEHKRFESAGGCKRTNG